MEAITNKEQEYLKAARKAGTQGNLLKAEAYYHMAREEHDKAVQEQYGSRYAA